MIIGAGRVGSALSVALNESGHRLLKIISRSINKAEKLAGMAGCVFGSELVIPPDTDLVIVAVNDDALYTVLHETEMEDNIVIAHTAGSVGLDVFHKDMSNTGVFYPLQTFTTGRSYDFSSVPLFIEANRERSREVLLSVASSVSRQVFELDSDKRKYLHLAAVFSCNFVNHMYYAGKEISAMAGMDFNVLLPLIRETMEKVSSLGPESSQTGPAVRNDKNTIEKHLDLLSFSPDLQKIYRVMTDSIINRYSDSLNG